MQVDWWYGPLSVLDHYLAQACDSVENGVDPIEKQLAFLIMLEVRTEINDPNLDPEFLAIGIYLARQGQKNAEWTCRTGLNMFYHLTSLDDQFRNTQSF